MSSNYIPVELLPKLYGVSSSTIHRWMKRDGVVSVWMPSALGSGRKALRKTDVPPSWPAMRLTPDKRLSEPEDDLRVTELFPGLSDKLCPVDRLPELCNVSARTIQRWMERDEVEVHWIDRKKYVAFADIDDWPLTFDIRHGDA